MVENSADPSRAAATNPTAESPLLPSQLFHNGAKNDFQSSSLPHLGDFITKLIEDAYKLQSANTELERTKQLLREAEDKLASSEETKSSLRTQLNRTKRELRKAEAKTAATEETLRTEQEKNEKLEAHSTLLVDQWTADPDHAMCVLDNYREASSKLRTLESHANDLEAELKRKNDALEQKDEAFQSKIHNYRAILSRLDDRHSDIDSVVDAISHHTKSLLFPNIEMQHILQGLETFKIDIKEDIDELFREVEWNRCKTKT